MNIVKVMIVMVAMTFATTVFGQRPEAARFCMGKADEAVRKDEMLVEETPSFIKKCVADLDGILDAAPAQSAPAPGRQQSFFPQLPTGERGQENHTAAAPPPTIVFGESVDYYRYQYPYNSYGSFGFGLGFPFGIPGQVGYGNGYGHQNNVHVVNPSCFDQTGNWEHNMDCQKIRNRQNLIGGGIAAAAIIAVRRHNR